MKIRTMIVMPRVSAISKAVMITVVIKQNQFRSLKNRIEIENKREIRKKKVTDESPRKAKMREIIKPKTMPIFKEKKRKIE